MKLGSASIRIVKAPAYATVQDAGRRGFLSSGVPRAGAMDQYALAVLNSMLGNESGAAGIEWALTGGQLEFDANATFAIGGADALVTLSGLKVEPYRAYHASAGQSLTTESLTAGRFLYICFAGGVDCERVMNSMSTYVPGGFGGIGGRRLATGDTISVGDVKRRVRAQVSDPLPDNLRPSMHSGIIRYVPRDSSDSFTGTFLVSAASDRTGYRLEGAVLIEGASVTSEAVCPGAIQLPPGGELIVLMADAPTIGGYRIMGAVIGADMGRLSQRLPGEAVQLIPVSVHQAQRELAARREMVERIREWALA